jgi:hypothetical protein
VEVTVSDEELLVSFLTWYDPEAEHSDVTPLEVVTEFQEEMASVQ